MKRILLTALIGVLSLSTHAQEIEVPKMQIPLITKISASWCPHCGAWGWDFNEQLMAENLEKAIMMTVHHSGNYETTAGEKLAANFGIISQPEFYLGTTKISANSGNFSNMVPMVTSSVNTISNEIPRAQSGLKLLMQMDGSIDIQARVQFFQQATGEFYLGVYIIENSFVGYQSQQGNNAQHKNLFRGAIGNDEFGDLLMAGAIAADQTFDIEHSFNLNASGFQSDNIEILAILWEKVGNRYEYVNANSSKNIELVSANEEVNNRVNLFQVSPNPVSTNAAIELVLNESLDQLSLDLRSLDGKKIAAVAVPDFLAAGTHRLPWRVNQRLPSGVYLLRLQSAQGVMSRRIVIP